MAEQFQTETAEAQSRLFECRRFKNLIAADLKEGYFFSAPRRARQVTSDGARNLNPPKDADTLQTSFGFELTEDFVTVVLNAFMPKENPWCERRAGTMVPEEAFKQVKDVVKDGDAKIFAAMRASNLYPEVAKSFKPDLALGTVGLWIREPAGGQDIIVTAVPLRELEINLGPFGELDDRFLVKYTKHRFVKALLPKIELPAEMQKEITDKPEENCEIVWGFWRLWEHEYDECWQHVVMLKGKVVHAVEIKGIGCCPLIVGRFGANADFPFADGPLVQALPDLRQLDELDYQRVQHGEMNLNPPVSFPDDSFASLANGLEAGGAYPIRPGTEGAIKPIYQPGQPDAAMYLQADKERRLRRMFFVDFPEQRGDTPPTATQWLDEMQLAQRRIGTPGLSFWREVPAKIFLRYQYLLEKAGVIEPVKVNGKQVSLQPYNPAERAAEQQEVALAVRSLEISSQFFPEEFRVKIDGGKTIENIVTKMRTQDMVAFRDPGEVDAAVQRIEQLLGAKAPDPRANPLAAAGAM